MRTTCMASNTHFTPSIVGSPENCQIGISITAPSWHFHAWRCTVRGPQGASTDRQQFGLKLVEMRDTL
jgi:hypothetical protein